MKNLLFSVLTILGTLWSNAQQDTLSNSDNPFLKASEALFGCKCYDQPDTLSYGVPRPLDNDEFMLDAFNGSLISRYGIDETEYSLGLLVNLKPEGKQIGNIWVDVSFASSYLYDKEDYYQDVAIVLPLCAFELLYRQSGSEAINEELRKSMEVATKMTKENL